MDKKLTRAELMAAQYGEKLKEFNSTAKEPLVFKADDKETLEQKQKLIKAREKLATFKDLVG